MIGTFAVGIAAVCNSAKDLCSKSLARKIPAAFSAICSFLFAIPLYLILLFILVLLDVPIFALGGTFYLYVILRASSDMFAELSKMHAFQHGDISLVSGFISLTPLFLLITSPLITGDLPSRDGIIGVILVTTGVIIMTDKSVSFAGAKKGILFGILAAFFFSINHCFDRLATFHAHPIVSSFWMTLFAAILLLPLNRKGLFSWKKDQLPLKLLIWRGVFEVTSMSARLWALQYLQAPYVSALMQVALLLSIIGGGVLFQEGKMKQRIIGGIVVISGSILILLQTS